MINVKDMVSSVVSNDKILNMIIQNKTIEEISKETGLSYKQLYRRITMLKNEGYNIKEKYYYSGDMSYRLSSSYGCEKAAIDIGSSEDFTAMLISDLHFCSKYEEIDALDMIYDYCIKNNIHIIINAGDLINGATTQNCSTEITDIRKQVEQALRQYPFDKNILNFIVLGNHDNHLLLNEKIDMARVISKERHDIVPLGYKSSSLKVNCDSIEIKHPFVGNSYNKNEHGFVIYGHFHHQQIISESNYIHLFLPSLSTLNGDGFNVPMAIQMTLNFQNNFIKEGIFETLIVKDKVYKVSETELEFSFNRNKVNQKKKK